MELGELDGATLQICWGKTSGIYYFKEYQNFILSL